MLNTNENNELHGNYDIYGYMPLWAWKNINIDVSGEQQHYIGLANISSGTMAVDLSLLNLYIRLYGKANKFSYYHGLQTVWGMGGIINVSDQQTAVALRLRRVLYKKSVHRVMQPCRIFHITVTEDI